MQHQQGPHYLMKQASGSPELPTLFADPHGEAIDGFHFPPKDTRQTRRRRNRIIAIVAVAAVVIATAVAVPVALTKSKSGNSSKRYQELYLPQGFAGTQLNGVLSANRTAVSSYDRLVV